MSASIPPTQAFELAHEVIQSVVHLTEQRDEQALLRSLLEAVLEMLPGVQASMLCLVPASTRGEWALDEVCPLPAAMFPITDWLVAEIASLDAETPSKLLSRDGQAYFIWSLGIQEDRRKAIVMRQPAWNAADLRIAQGILKIHANYASVLFDSERDTLTGLFNRKKLEQKLGEILTLRGSSHYQRQRDQETDDYLAVFDIDRFKRINDNHGHLIGDEVLIIFAGLVRNALRDIDWVFRYGGEEFVALIRGVSAGTIEAILERLRLKVQDHAFPQVGQVTVSIGYTAITDQKLPSHLFEEADKALYYAKEHGRNRVCDYRDLVRRGEIPAEAHPSGSVELF